MLGGAQPSRINAAGEPAPSAAFLKRHFLLDPAVTYLNHAAYGATPRPVFDAFQRYQLELEREPVDFLSRQFQSRMAGARAALATHLDADPDDIVYVNNGSVGMNIIAHGLQLGPGDEVLTSDHEHGGIDRLWRYWAQKRGFTWVVRPVAVPLTSREALVEQIWEGVTPRTRAIVLSHLTSPTSLVFPVEEICQRARAANILSIIDGSHVPGQLPLSLRKLGAHFYVGITHKWLCSPKGSAFLFARRAVQDLLDPLVISWGWEARNPAPSKFVELHEWQGSRDVSAYLAVPDAIEFQAAHCWDAVRARCRAMASRAQAEVARLTGVEPWHPPSPEWHGQVICAPLPPGTDDVVLGQRLRFEHQIDVSVDRFRGQPRVRISVQGYNDWQDIERLLVALERCL